MTVLTTSAGRLDARPTSRTAGFRVELLRDWRQAVARWQDSSPSTPFQHPQWYDAWYRAFADAEGIEPLIAVVTDASTGEPVVLLPLIRRRQNNIATVEFADLDLTDYNAPILGPAAPRDAKAARALWRSLLRRCAGCPRRPISFVCAKFLSISTASQIPLPARRRRPVLAQRQSRHDRRGLRRLAPHAGKDRAKGAGAELARVHARSGRVVRDHHRHR
jgi:CelD/BcsL family acetyltransferase involved in cellulose biosynthesis